MKSIYIAYTGGTIGMKKTNTGYATESGYLQSQMAAMPAMQHPDMPSYTLKEYAPLLDSANMQIQDWQQIAKDIADNYANYDGFIILHGTDTMAYSASALSFMLGNLAKPVIFTGSQVPLCEVHTDARENLINAILLACRDNLPEVGVFFNNTLYRGNRTVKINSSSFNAYASPNYPSLAEVGIDITVAQHRVLPAPKDAFALLPLESHLIAHMELKPSLDNQLLEKVLELPLKGIILETYGRGNGASNDQGLLDLLKQAVARDIIVVNKTQCLHGTVNMDNYETGQALQQLGVVNAHDMTLEALYCKLQFLLSQSYTTAQIKELVSTELRGEMS